MSDGRRRPDVDIGAVDSRDETGIQAYLAIRNATTPDSPDSAANLRWAEATYPGQGTTFLATDGAGAAVGTASVGRIWMHGPDYERWWLGVWVVPEARGQGIGTVLFQACSDAARAAGKTGFQTELSEAHVDGHRFLAARGFVEVERTKAVRLDLAGVAKPRIEPPPGITLTTLAARPDLLPAVHRAALGAFPDVPTGGEPLYAGTFDEFVARDVDRPDLPREGFVIAVDDATGEVAGYGNLILQAGSDTIGLHDMTAVRPAWRGRGIATAIKRATIAWAIDNGLAALETGNDEHNAPMRAVNRRLGYEPMPDEIYFRGPATRSRVPA